MHGFDSPLEKMQAAKNVFSLQEKPDSLPDFGCKGCVIRCKVQNAKGNNFAKLDVFVIKAEKLRKHQALRNKIAHRYLPFASLYSPQRNRDKDENYTPH